MVNLFNLDGEPYLIKADLYMERVGLFTVRSIYLSIYIYIYIYIYVYISIYKFVLVICITLCEPSYAKDYVR